MTCSPRHRWLFAVRRTVCVLLAASATAACRGHADREDAPSENATLAQLAEAVRSAAGQRTCMRDRDCRRAPFGYQACGSPQRYLIYSQVDTDEAALARALAQYHQQERQVQKRRGTISTCMHVPPPHVVCRRHRCERRTQPELRLPEAPASR